MISRARKTFCRLHRNTEPYMALTSSERQCRPGGRNCRNVYVQGLHRYLGQAPKEVHLSAQNGFASCLYVFGRSL